MTFAEVTHRELPPHIVIREHHQETVRLFYAIAVLSVKCLLSEAKRCILRQTGLTKNYTKPATPADNLVASARRDLRIIGGGDRSSVVSTLALAHAKHWVPVQHHMNWPVWHSAGIPGLRVWKEEVCKLKVFLGYVVS